MFQRFSQFAPTALFALGLSIAAPATAAEKPNFVVIFVDDLGYNDVGSFGSPHISTPNIDRLASEGSKLTSFYAQAVCGPSRAALMTGSYPNRMGEIGNKKHQHTVPHPEEITLAEQLKSAGYETGAIGKWHLAGHGGRMRGMKMSTWEGGLRVPGIVRWPDHVPASRVTHGISTTLDLFATFSNLAGAELPDDRTLDSIDMTDYWPGKRDSSTSYIFYYYAYTHRPSVFHGKRKLVRSRPAQPGWAEWSGRMIDGVAEPQLYNLEEDVAELNDVADQHSEVVERLQGLLESGRKELGDYNLVGTGARFFEPNAPGSGDKRNYPRGSARDNMPTKLSTGRGNITFDYETALEHESGVRRRDPSDVIRHSGKYYVWYTKVPDAPDTWRYPSGYSGQVYYATSEDGHRFTEQGPAIDHAKDDAWDGHGVFTPNILKWKGRCYLYYTGVGRPFGADSLTAIGEIPQWGVAMRRKEGDLYLVRLDMQY